MDLKQRASQFGGSDMGSKVEHLEIKGQWGNLACIEGGAFGGDVA